LFRTRCPIVDGFDALAKLLQVHGLQSVEGGVIARMVESIL
jgi:hypothetical protein